MIHFIAQQYKFGCRVGLGRGEAITRAVRVYLRGFK